MILRDVHADQKTTRYKKIWLPRRQKSLYKGHHFFFLPSVAKCVGNFQTYNLFFVCLCPEAFMPASQSYSILPFLFPSFSHSTHTHTFYYTHRSSTVSSKIPESLSFFPSPKLSHLSNRSQFECLLLLFHFEKSRTFLTEEEKNHASTLSGTSWPRKKKSFKTPKMPPFSR